MVPIRIPLAFVLTVATVSFAGTERAEAQAVDLDCKLLICLPGGFPSGCGDARDHMIDRLRHGKSPIGVCDTGRGDGFEDYEIAYDFHDATSRKGWACPEGEGLYHTTSRYDDDRRRRIVRTFCYEDRDSVRIGPTTRYYYIGRSAPERTDMSVAMTFAPESEAAHRTGRIALDTGFVRDWRTLVYHTE